MKKLIMTCAALGLGAGMAAADDAVVRLGTEGAYEPWNYLNDAGEVDGFEREVGDELCKRAELNCVWVTSEWDSIIPNLVSGNYDAIIAGMSITDERDEVIDFSEEYTPADPSPFLAMDAGLDVTTAVIAAQTNTIHSGFVAEQGWTLVEFATLDEAVSALRNGEADALLSDAGYLGPIAEADDQLVILDRAETIGGGVGMGFRESDAELRNTFNAAIISMKEDGTLNTLITKWEVSSTWD